MMATDRFLKSCILPDLIIIGAAKCGTTSLHYYLGVHPEIFMAREKELGFFVREMNWDKGAEWYKSNFKGKAKVYGETTPQYTNHPFYPGVAKRMYSTVPYARLIYILRNPIDRIISHYIQHYAIHLEDRNINEVINQSKMNLYTCQSMYYMQLEQYLEYYPESHILIITLEDLFHHRQKTMQRVFNFLNVDPDFYSKKFSQIKNRASVKRRKTGTGLLLQRIYDAGPARFLPRDKRRRIGRLFSIPFSKQIEIPKLDDVVHQGLIDYLSNDINQLRKFTGRKFKDWTV